MSKYAGVLIVSMIVLLASCHTTKNIVQSGPLDQGNPVGITRDSVAHLFKKVRNRFFDFNTFSCKAKVSYSDQKNGVINFNATIRMKKDSVIWMSISPGMGIEAYRILITRDSIHILDRLNQKYIGRGFSFLSEVAGYPVDLHDMQNIIAGVPIGYKENTLSATAGDSSLLFASIDSDWESNIMVNNKNFLVSQFFMHDSLKKKKIQIQFYNYNFDNSIPFSLDRYMEINNPDPITISIDYSKIKINESLKFPFNNKYE